MTRFSLIQGFAHYIASPLFLLVLVRGSAIQRNVVSHDGALEQPLTSITQPNVVGVREDEQSLEQPPSSPQQQGKTTINISERKWYEGNARGEHFDNKREQVYHAFSPAGQSGDSYTRYYDLFMWKNAATITLVEADCLRVKFRHISSGKLQPTSDRVQFESDQTDWQDANSGSIVSETIKMVCGQSPLKSPVADPMQKGRRWVLATPAEADERAKSFTLAEQRQAIINDILRRKDHPETIADVRSVCAHGSQPQFVKKARNDGDDSFPDAGDLCAAALKRKAQDGRLLELYETLVEDTGVKPEELFSSIASAAANDKAEVRLGRSGIVHVSPALALDAGYTQASLKGITMASLQMADTEDNARRVKDTTAGCLDNQNKAAPTRSACFVTGIALAAKDNSSKNAK